MTPTHEARRKNTEYARAARARLLAEKNANATTCQALLANGHPCRTPLHSRYVDGETLPFCPTCDRKVRGCCIVCSAPVIGQPRKALYCALHRRLAKQAAGDRHAKTHRRQLKKKENLRLLDPVKHADRLTYKRLARHAKPQTVQAYKRADYLKHREQRLAYHAAYRARKKAERAATELARYHGTLPPRTCLTCPTVLTGRPKKCDACKRAHRQAARAAILARLERAA